MVHVNRPGVLPALLNSIHENSGNGMGSMMSIAKHSLSTLQKAGFEVAYEKAVYGLSVDNQPTATSRHQAEPSS
jgi:hypothetical protein